MDVGWAYVRAAIKATNLAVVGFLFGARVGAGAPDQLLTFLVGLAAVRDGAEDSAGGRRVGALGLSDSRPLRSKMDRTMQPTLFLITSAHRGWRHLRSILDQCPDVHVVGEVQQADQAVPAAATWRPAVMLVDADVAGQEILPLIQDLHTSSPTSRILMLGDEAMLERATLLKLGQWVAAYLMWADLRPETVLNCLALVLGNDLVIGSRAVLEEVLAPLECRHHPQRKEIVLRSRERAVLQRLACGLTQQEIADAEYMSVSSVKRTVATLRKKLEAPTEFVLGMKAVLQGLVSEPGALQTEHRCDPWGSKVALWRSPK
jgi:DNA-binding NarL/FixJ family response regulator